MTSRRTFLRDASSCAAHIALAAAATPLMTRRLWAARPGGTVVAVEPFGRLERVEEGIWALISAPLSGDRTTLSNGGIIAGRNGVLAVEGFMTPEGARWLATQAKALTGMWPTHCVITHYHADHANGVAGYTSDATGAHVRVTNVTRDLVLARNLPADAPRASVLSGAVAIDASAATELDLGGRRVRLVPRAGHTTSDVTVEVDDPSVVFCGDLVWNGMFPNYVDAQPVLLGNHLAALRRSRPTRYVPGHGDVAAEADVARYAAVLAEVEEAARRAGAAGVPASQAAATFRISPQLGEWVLFSPAFFPRAFEAWDKVLRR